MLLKPSHFELLYYTNLHYDAVMAEDTGRVSIDHPHFVRKVKCH